MFDIKINKKIMEQLLLGANTYNLRFTNLVTCPLFDCEFLIYISLNSCSSSVISLESAVMEIAKPSSSSAVTNKKNKRRVQKGFEVCVHTCVPGGCVNPTTKTILWRNEGHSCRRHACISKAHPSCVGEPAECPGYKLLGQTGHPKNGAREPTADELTLINDIPLLVYPTRVIKQEGLATNIFKYPAQESVIRPFDIIFIPDPSLESNKERALVDLAFIQTTVSMKEWKSMEHLKGSIHHILNLKTDKNRKHPEHKVCMQEWVSLLSYRL